MSVVLITGAAGFIGFHAAQRLLDEGARVVGVDNLTPYYDVSLKEERLALLARHPAFSFERLDLADRGNFVEFARSLSASHILHLAAQAGVRHSIDHPHEFVDANLVGFANLLEVARATAPRHVVFASSSSVYGAGRGGPSRVDHDTSHPLSLYAATKKANEVMAHAYAHLFGLTLTGARFFTVYGPWGRPDMAAMSFLRRIYAGEPIPVFGAGRVQRDFTYIDDVVEALTRLLRIHSSEGPTVGAADATPRFALYNIGNRRPATVDQLLSLMERHTGRRAIRLDQPLPASDPTFTCADVSDLERATGFAPGTTLEQGIPRLVAWYREYYRHG